MSLFPENLSSAEIARRAGVSPTVVKRLRTDPIKKTVSPRTAVLIGDVIEIGAIAALRLFSAIPDEIIDRVILEARSLR